MRPLSTFQKRIKSFKSVDFPLPLRPAIPITEFFGISTDTLSRIISSPYANVTFSDDAPLNSIFCFPPTSSTTGFSSRISRTLFPAANVFCNVLPSAASATTGPKELISATTGISTPSNPTAPFTNNIPLAKSINTSKNKITVLVTAVFLPEKHFIFASFSLSSSIFSFICARRFLPVPNCCICGSPLRLSSTNADNSPDFVRKTSPMSPLNFETASGIITPTVI